MSLSEDSRVLLEAVILEIAAIAASYFTYQWLLSGPLEYNGGLAFTAGFVLATVPASIWIGVRASGITVDQSPSYYLGLALVVATVAGAIVFGTGVVIDIFDCGAPSPGATGSSSGAGCEKVFPSFTTVIAVWLAALDMIPIILFSVLAGYFAWKVRRIFE